MYLDGATGNVWSYNGTIWVFTGINIKGPTGGSAVLPTVGGSTIGYGSSTAIALTVPAGTSSGDLLVVLSNGNAPGYVIPTGVATDWIAGDYNGNGSSTAWLAYGTAPAGASGQTVTCTYSGTNNYAHLIVVKGWKMVMTSAAYSNANALTRAGVPLSMSADSKVLVLGAASWRNNGATITSNLSTTLQSANNGANLASKSFSGTGASKLAMFRADSNTGAENAAVAIAIGG